MQAGGKLTTHVLDTARGKPAAGLLVELRSLEGNDRRLVKAGLTNADGRLDEPLLAGAALLAGQYELLFHVGDYFGKAGTIVAKTPFLDVVPVRFGVDDATAHYHVPLLFSPWSYSIYRGS